MCFRKSFNRYSHLRAASSRTSSEGTQTRAKVRVHPSLSPSPGWRLWVTAWPAPRSAPGLARLQIESFFFEGTFGDFHILSHEWNIHNLLSIFWAHNSRDWDKVSHIIVADYESYTLVVFMSQGHELWYFWHGLYCHLHKRFFSTCTFYIIIRCFELYCHHYY